MPVAYTVKYGFAPALRKADRSELIARSHGDLKRLFMKLDSNDLKALSEVSRRSERKEGKVSYESFRTSGDRAVIVTRGSRSIVEFHCIRTPDGWKVEDMIVRRRGRWTSLVSSLRLVTDVRSMMRDIERGRVPDRVSPALAVPLGRILASGLVRSHMRELSGAAASVSGDRRRVRTLVNGHRATVSVSAGSLVLSLGFTEKNRRWHLTGGQVSSGRVHVPLTWALGAAASWTQALDEWHSGSPDRLRRLVPAWVGPVLDLLGSGHGTINGKSSYHAEMIGFLSSDSWPEILKGVNLKSFDGRTLTLSVKAGGRRNSGSPSGSDIGRLSAGPYTLDITMVSGGVISDFAFHSSGMSFSRRSAAHILSCIRAHLRMRNLASGDMTPSGRAALWNEFRGCVCPSVARRMRTFAAIHFPVERLVPRFSGLPAALTLGPAPGRPSGRTDSSGIVFSRDVSGVCVSGLYTKAHEGLNLVSLAPVLSTLLTLYEGLASDSPALAASAFTGAAARQFEAGLRRLLDFRVPVGALVCQWTRALVPHRKSGSSFSGPGRTGRFQARSSGRGQWVLALGDLVKIRFECTGKTCVISGGYVSLARKSRIPLLLAARIFPASLALASGLARGRVRRNLLGAFSSRHVHFVWKLLAHQGMLRKYVGWYDLKPSGPVLEAERLLERTEPVLLAVKTVWNPAAGWAEFHVVSGQYGRSVVYFVRSRRGYWVFHDAAGVLAGRRVRLSSLGHMSGILGGRLGISLPKLGF